MQHQVIVNLRILLIISFFILFFILFTGPIEDGDCFWHLATGRWIAEHHTIPKTDPFSFTVADHNPFRPESRRVEFLLKQYWLGQLAMYGAWELGGNTGIILMRASIYSAILIFLYMWMRRFNKGVFAIVLTALTGLLLREFPNERPQLFSFLFMPLVLYLLEAATGTEKPRRAALMALPLVMLVWANTHGAYILGVVIISLYLVTHLVACITRRERPDYPFIASAVAGMAISIITPAGILVWTQLFSTLPGYISSISENLSPWNAAVNYHFWYPAYWVYLLISITGLLIYWRKMTARHILIIAALALLSLTAVRHIVYMLFAAPILIRYLPEIPCKVRSLTAVTVGFAAWLGCTWDGHFLEFRENANFPVGAVAFMKQEAPAPQVFNYYDWGGYLEWSVPGLKTFIDGRGLVEEIAILHDRTLAGEKWRNTLDRYNINTVIIPGMNLAAPGKPLSLPIYLANASEWKMVFVDNFSLIFVRDIPANQDVIARHTLNRLALQLHLLKITNYLIAKSPNREEYWQTKADALAQLGDRQGALAAYRKTLQINPRNEWARRVLAVGKD